VEQRVKLKGPVLGISKLEMTKQQHAGKWKT